MPSNMLRDRAFKPDIGASKNDGHESYWPLKIVFAIKSLSVQGGGAERCLSEVTSGLAARGHIIKIITFDRLGTPSFYPLHKSVDRLDIGIGDSHQPAHLLETAQRILLMRRILNNLRPDVVVGFMHSMFVPMGVALLGTGVPLVASEHIVPAHYKSRPFQALALQLVPWFARRITVVSSQARAAYPARLRARMTVIPNPLSINPSKYADVEGKTRSRKTLLAVGRLSAQKDHATLIKAFAKIADRLPDWDLRVVGEGEMRFELEASIASLGLDKRVQLPGAIRDISAEYAAAQLYVISSTYESQGLATAEALAHGLPAVGFTDCPGTNLLIQHGYNGILVRPNQDRAGSLACALEPLMCEASERLRLVPKPRPPTKESSEDVFRLWTSMLSSVAS